MTKREFLYDGDTFTHAGHTFIVSIEDDNDHGAPWKESDGHGPVTEWISRDKKPGERVLHADRNSKRFYDFAEATRIAKRDGWGLGDEAREALTIKLGRAPTPSEVIAQAVENDFQYLHGWCNDEWRYVGVCVRHESQDHEDRYSYACWGIESDCDEYIAIIAHENAAECLHDIEREKTSERANLKTQRETFSKLALELRNSSKLGDTICEVTREKLAGIVQSRHASMARIVELSA